MPLASAGIQEGESNHTGQTPLEQIAQSDQKIEIELKCNSGHIPLHSGVHQIHLVGPLRTTPLNVKWSVQQVGPPAEDQTDELNPKPRSRKARPISIVAPRGDSFSDSFGSVIIYIYHIYIWILGIATLGRHVARR